MRRRFLSLFLSLTMVVSTMASMSMMPAITAYAEEIETEIETEVTASVTIRAQAGGAYLSPINEVTVSSKLSDVYGYSDYVEGAVSAIDALIAVHKNIYGDDFTVESKDNYLVVSKAGYILKIFEEQTYANGFLVNEGYPNDGIEGSYGGYNGLTVSYTPLADGDTVDFLVYQDSATYGDFYTFIDMPESVEAGKEFAVTITGTPYMSGYMYETPAAFKAAAAPLEGVKFGWVDLSTGYVTEIADIKSDEDGKATLTAPEEKGTFYLTAMTDPDSDDDNKTYALLNPQKLNVFEKEVIGLTITNETALFKAVSASLEISGSESVLIMALNGTGYKELYKGTYEEAVTNGDGSAANGNDTWIHYSLNDAGKYEFRIPLSESELSGSIVPVVAVSASKYSAYLSGGNELAKAFYSKQIKVNKEAKTLEVGTFNMTEELTIVNNSKKFSLTGAYLNTVAGQNDNNYQENVILSGTGYDKAFIGTKKEAEEAEAEQTISAVDGQITLTVKANTLGGNLVTDYMDKETIVSLYSEENETWNEFKFTVSKNSKKLTVDTVPIPAETVTENVQPDSQDPDQPDSQDPNQPDSQDPPQQKITDMTVTSTLSNKIAAGKKVQLKIKITPEEFETQGVTWKSSNTKFATVDAKGLVTTKKAGIGKKVTITATGYGNKTASITLSIMKGAVKKITISGKKTAKVGKKLKLKAKVTTTASKANKKVTWTSSNPKIAKVTSNGTVTMLKAGTVKITVKATDGSGKKATIKIKVKK